MVYRTLNDVGQLAGEANLDNPWTSKFIVANWSQLLSAVNGRADWMPIVRAEGARGKVTLERPLGCGHYGCVYATPSTDNTPLSTDPAVVCKVSSDVSEVNFVRLAMQWPWPEGIVRYHAVMDVPGSHRRRPIAVIWREAARDVGKHGPFEDDYEKRNFNEFRTYHEAYLTAARYLREQSIKPTWPKNAEAAVRYADWARRETIWEDGIDWSKQLYRRKPDEYVFFMKRHDVGQRIAAALNICRTAFEMMSGVNYAYQAAGALSYYLERGLLLADVHLMNIGTVDREDHDSSGLQVITDPGHAVVIPNVQAFHL